MTDKRNIAAELQEQLAWLDGPAWVIDLGTGAVAWTNDAGAATLGLRRQHGGPYGGGEHRLAGSPEAATEEAAVEITTSRSGRFTLDETDTALRRLKELAKALSVEPISDTRRPRRTAPKSLTLDSNTIAETLCFSQTPIVTRLPCRCQFLTGPMHGLAVVTATAVAAATRQEQRPPDIALPPKRPLTWLQRARMPKPSGARRAIRIAPEQATDDGALAGDRGHREDSPGKRLPAGWRARLRRVANDVADDGWTRDCGAATAGTARAERQHPRLRLAGDPDHEERHRSAGNRAAATMARPAAARDRVQAAGSATDNSSAATDRETLKEIARRIRYGGAGAAVAADDDGDAGLRPPFNRPRIVIADDDGISATRDAPVSREASRNSARPEPSKSPSIYDILASKAYGAAAPGKPAGMAGPAARNRERGDDREDGSNGGNEMNRGQRSPPAASKAPCTPDSKIAAQTVQELAHELRTPLSAIQTAAAILAEETYGPVGDARYKTYATDIEDSARHALAVVNGMLQVDHPANELPKLEFTQLNLDALLRSTLSQSKPLAAKAGIELCAKFERDLPHVIADARSIKQMLLNLLTNALKFTPAGGRITMTSAYELDGPLRVTIADTGPGMSPAQIEAIMRGQPANGPAHGGKLAEPDADGQLHGLGLPLTRRLARANNASLELTSNDRQGDGDLFARGLSASLVFPKDRLVPVW